MSRKLTKLVLVAVMTAVLFALASFNAFAAKSYTSDGTDMDSVIQTALSDAATDDVTITLTGTWTFSSEPVFGDPASIPSHTVTIDGGTINTAGYMPSFCGNLVFKNVNFVGAKSSRYASRGNADAANGLYFPEGASCVIDEGCTGSVKGSGTEIGVNLAGDSVEVKSGKFYIVCAQMYGNANTVDITDPHITVSGSTELYCAIGGGYNLGRVLGKVDLKVRGGATVTGFACGGYYSASTGIGGTVDIDTDADSRIYLIAAAVGTSGITNSENVGEYTVNVKSSANLNVSGGIAAVILNGDGSECYLNTTINVYDGVTLAGNNWFNVRGGTSGTVARATKAHGKTVTNIYGGTFNGDVFGGSGLYKADSFDACDIELNISGGAFKGSINAGSDIQASGSTCTGNLKITVIDCNCADLKGVVPQTAEAEGFTPASKVVDLSGFPESKKSTFKTFLNKVSGFEESEIILPDWYDPNEKEEETPAETAPETEAPEVDPFEGLPRIYIASAAKGTGDGSSPENAMGNADDYASLVSQKDGKAYLKNALRLGFDALKDTGGTVVVCGPLTVDSADAFRESPAEFHVQASNINKLFKLTSVYGDQDYRTSGAKLILDQTTCQSLNLIFRSKVTIENITIDYKYSKGTSWYKDENATMFIMFNGMESVVGEGVVVNAVPASGATAGRYPSLIAGHRYSEVASTNLTVKSGTWYMVIAGSHGMGEKYPGTVKGDAKLTVSGGTIAYLLGEGGMHKTYSPSSEIQGNLEVIIEKGAVVKNANGSFSNNKADRKTITYDVTTINKANITNFSTATQTGEGNPPPATGSYLTVAIVCAVIALGTVAAIVSKRSKIEE